MYYHLDARFVYAVVVVGREPRGAEEAYLYLLEVELPLAVRTGVLQPCASLMLATSVS